MNEQQTQPAGERVYERCLCREAVDQLRDRLKVSPAVRQHLMNSRVEFLKAVRAIIDDRIDRLSTRAQPGTKVPVE